MRMFELAVTSEVVNNRYLTVPVVVRRRFDPDFSPFRTAFSCMVFPLVRHVVEVRRRRPG